MIFLWALHPAGALQRFQIGGYKKLRFLPPFTGATLFLFPRLGSLPDVHARLLAVVEEGRPALVAGVVRLQPAARQITASHFHHSNIRLFQLK